MYDHMRAVTHYTPAADMNYRARGIHKAAHSPETKPQEIYDLVSAYLFDTEPIMHVENKTGRKTTKLAEFNQATKFAKLDQDKKPSTPRVHPWKEELDNTMFYI